MTKAWRLLKQEIVLVLAFAAAVASMGVVPPDAGYGDYIDWRVLGLLFCLMAVVGGLDRAGCLRMVTQRLLAGGRTPRNLYFLLVGLPFFLSMLVTNDVALLTFVPFAILVLTLTGLQRYLPYVVVMQTVAANLGSMVTPVGNPQNLFLYTQFSLSAGQIVIWTLPLAVLSLALLAGGSLIVRGNRVEVPLAHGVVLENGKQAVLHLSLLLLCLGAVLRLFSVKLVFAIVLIALLVGDRPTLKRVDYSLLFTFVCFFIFAGNMARIPAIQLFLKPLLQQHTFAAGVMVSQIISNVPAAILLAPFTQDARGLLLGTNVGGLGTIIASLASLISFRLYAKTAGARPLLFLGIFTLVNFLFLAVLVMICSLQ